jgi:hypothetical protein
MAGHTHELSMTTGKICIDVGTPCVFCSYFHTACLLWKLANMLYGCFFCTGGHPGKLLCSGWHLCSAPALHEQQV